MGLHSLLGTLGTCALLGLGLLLLGLWLWHRAPRRYRSGRSVATAYDDWTRDGLLEDLWGEHIHLGHYGRPPGRRDFREAKADLVRILARWGGLDQLPRGSTVLDVGCGIGGSSRLLAREFGLRVIGISISPGQIERARSLTPADLDCHFMVMDALDLDLADASVDAVWTVEAAPHIADKQRFASELLRVLRPGGLLVAADWNRRDDHGRPFSPLESWVLEQLQVQWAHPPFASIRDVCRDLGRTGLGPESADWSRETLPSWPDSILEGVRRPIAVLRHGPGSLIKALREVPTILLMWWAFGTGLMQFGVFRLQVADADRSLDSTQAGSSSTPPPEVPSSIG
jgi:MPBQ/MSBQ methyltransferase